MWSLISNCKIVCIHRGLKLFRSRNCTGKSFGSKFLPNWISYWPWNERHRINACMPCSFWCDRSSIRQHIMDWPWWQWLSLDGQRTLFEHQRSHSSHLDRDQMLTATWHVTHTLLTHAMHTTTGSLDQTWESNRGLSDVCVRVFLWFSYDMCFVSMVRSISNLSNSPSQRNWTSKVWISWAGCLSNQPEPVLAKETWASDVSPCVTMCSYSMLQLSQFLKPFFEWFSPTFSCHCHHPCRVVEPVDVSALQFSLCCPEVQRGSGCSAEVIQICVERQSIFSPSVLSNMKTDILDL